MITPQACESANGFEEPPLKSTQHVVRLLRSADAGIAGTCGRALEILPCSDAVSKSESGLVVLRASW
jgi:hypothetical protein